MEHNRSKVFLSIQAFILTFYHLQNYFTDSENRIIENYHMGGRCFTGQLKAFIYTCSFLSMSRLLKISFYQAVQN